MSEILAGLNFRSGRAGGMQLPMVASAVATKDWEEDETWAGIEVSTRGWRR